MDEDCLMLSAYFDERQRTGRDFLDDQLLALHEQRGVATSVVLRGTADIAVCDLLYRRKLAGASVLGVDGTVAGKRTRARFLRRNIDVTATPARSCRPTVAIPPRLGFPWAVTA